MLVDEGDREGGERVLEVEDRSDVARYETSLPYRHTCEKESVASQFRLLEKW